MDELVDKSFLYPIRGEFWVKKREDPSFSLKNWTVRCSFTELNLSETVLSPYWIFWDFNTQYNDTWQHFCWLTTNAFVFGHIFAFFFFFSVHRCWSFENVEQVNIRSKKNTKGWDE